MSFFGSDSPSARLEREYGSHAIRDYRTEDLAEKLIHDLMPHLDRADWMLMRNIRVNVNAPSQFKLAERQMIVREQLS